MIYHLHGKISSKKEDFFIIDVKGIGYKVFMDADSMKKIPSEGSECKIFCYFSLGDKIVKIYGFLAEEHLELFEFLLGISGIGPETAIRIANIGSIEKLKKGLESDDEEIIDKIMKIGKKKGERVVFEVSRKQKVRRGGDEDALKALRDLGFSRKEAESALREVPKKISTEDKIKRSLKFLGNGKNNG